MTLKNSDLPHAQLAGRWRGGEGGSPSSHGAAKQDAIPGPKHWRTILSRLNVTTSL